MGNLTTMALVFDRLKMCGVCVESHSNGAVTLDGHCMGADEWAEFCGNFASLPDVKAARDIGFHVPRTAEMERALSG